MTDRSSSSSSSSLETTEHGHVYLKCFSEDTVWTECASFVDTGNRISGCARLVALGCGAIKCFEVICSRAEKRICPGYFLHTKCTFYLVQVSGTIHTSRLLHDIIRLVMWRSCDMISFETTLGHIYTCEQLPELTSLSYCREITRS